MEAREGRHYYYEGPIQVLHGPSSPLPPSCPLPPSYDAVKQRWANLISKSSAVSLQEASFIENLPQHVTTNGQGLMGYKWRE